LIDIIHIEGVGYSYTGESLDELQAIAEKFVNNPDTRAQMAARGPGLAQKLFSPSSAVTQITAELFKHKLYTQRT